MPRPDAMRNDADSHCEFAADRACDEIDRLEATLRFTEQRLITEFSRRLECAQEHIIDRILRIFEEDTAVEVGTMPPKMDAVTQGVKSWNSEQPIYSASLLMPPLPKAPDAPPSPRCVATAPVDDSPPPVPAPPRALKFVSSPPGDSDPTGLDDDDAPVVVKRPSKKKPTCLVNKPADAAPPLTGLRFSIACATARGDFPTKPEGLLNGMCVRNSLQGKASIQANLVSFVRSTYFEQAVLATVFVNVLFVAVDIDARARSENGGTSPTAIAIRWFFAAVFIGELALRLLAYGRTFFASGPERMWHMLDVVCIAATLLDCSLDLATPSSVQMGIRGAVNELRMARMSRITRFLRMTRMLRLLRFLRWVQQVRAMRMLVCQVAESLRRLAWTACLLLGVSLMVAVLLTDGVAWKLREVVHGGRDSAADEALSEFFGSVPRSMLSLWQGISGGVDWRILYAPLERCGWFWGLWLLVYIAFVKMFLLNLITGVFCQAAHIAVQRDDDLTAREVLASRGFHKRQLEALFASMDTDKDGIVLMREFEALLMNHNVRQVFEALAVEASDVQLLFDLLDTEGASLVTLDEFVDGVLRVRGCARQLDLAKLGYEQKWISRQVDVLAGRLEEVLGALRQRGSEIAVRM